MRLPSAIQVGGAAGSGTGEPLPADRTVTGDPDPGTVYKSFTCPPPGPIEPAVRSLQVIASPPYQRAETLPAACPEVLERVAAGLLLCGCAPILLMAGTVVWLLSGRSPLVGHLRCGLNGAPLWALKLRTMWPKKERRFRTRLIAYVIDETGPLEKRVGDTRVRGWFARFCRRHSIDELPQLWNVVRGEMSLVGPRPLTHSELSRFYGRDADEVIRVKPGLTGLWQVRGGSRLTYDERRRLDLYLVRHHGPRLYWTLLLRTVPVVFRGEDGC